MATIKKVFVPSPSPKYLIFEGGYTCRLICQLGFVPYDVDWKTGALTRKEEDPNKGWCRGCHRCREEEEPDDIPRVVFLYDDRQQGSGLYASPGLEAKSPEQNTDFVNLLHALKLGEYNRGIVFQGKETSPRQCNQWLEDQRFCGYYGFDRKNYQYLDDQGKLFAEVYEMDSESG